jgi:hypothetical protein
MKFLTILTETNSLKFSSANSVTFSVFKSLRLSFVKICFIITNLLRLNRYIR